jgi:hypothetical protein
MYLAAALSPTQVLFLIQYELLFVLGLVNLAGVAYLVYRALKRR